MKSDFIVFEGIDGSGTSTQAKLLQDHLLARGRKTVLTAEPSTGPIGSVIKLAFSGKLNLTSAPRSFDRQMAYLFAADRYDHLHNEQDGVLQFLKKGITVISTRYFFSSYAYHCVSKADFALVEQLNSSFPNPDLVIYLKNPVSSSISRLRHRKFRDVYETASKLSVVSRNYQSLFEDYSGRLLMVDATKSAAAIHAEIAQYVDNQGEAND